VSMAITPFSLVYFTSGVGSSLIYPMYLSEFVSPPCGWVVAQPVSFPTGEGHPVKLLPKGRRHVGAGGRAMALFLGNAFSLGMISPGPQGLTLRVRQLSLEEVKDLLKEESFTSAVGHQATAEVLTLLTGTPIPVNRIAVSLSLGDRLIVFQLRVRLEEGRILTAEEVQAMHEQGLTSFYLVEVVG